MAQGPKPKFTSRYADPNHPASSGNIISLVTGGHINPPSFGGGGLGGGLGGGGRGLGGGLGGVLRGRGLGMMGGAERGGGIGGRGRLGGRSGYINSESGFGGPGGAVGGRNMGQDPGPRNSIGGGRTIGSSSGVGIGGLPSFGGPQAIKKLLKKVSHQSLSWRSKYKGHRTKPNTRTSYTSWWSTCPLTKRSRPPWPKSNRIVSLGLS